MMKRFIRFITCISLAAVTVFSAAVVNAFAAEISGDTVHTALSQADGFTETAFTCIEDVDHAVQKIFSENQAQLHTYARTLNHMGVDDRYYTYYCGSCGPMSKAFQKVLADHNIYVEERKQNVNTETHAYNLMRVSFDGGQTVTNVVIDPTYKQTMRDYFKQQFSCQTDNEIDRAIQSVNLPAVNVFEFGDTDALDARINGCLEKQGLPHFDVSRTMSYYEPTRYPEYELQATYDTFLTARQIAQIQHIGHLNKPFDSDLFLMSVDNSLSYPMTYEDNGIYTCLIKADDFADKDAALFTVCDENGNIIYGSVSGTIVSGYYPYHFSYCSRKQQQFLSGNSDAPFTVLCDSREMLLRVDVRAGIDAPVVNLLPVNSYLHGDLNNDGRIDEQDIAIAENPHLYPVTLLAQYSMDFYGDGSLPEQNLTLLKEYVAAGADPTGKIGSPFYQFQISSFHPLLLEI